MKNNNGINAIILMRVGIKSELRKRAIYNSNLLNEVAKNPEDYCLKHNLKYGNNKSSEEVALNHVRKRCRELTSLYESLVKKYQEYDIDDNIFDKRIRDINKKLEQVPVQVLLEALMRTGKKEKNDEHVDEKKDEKKEEEKEKNLDRVVDFDAPCDYVRAIMITKQYIENARSKELKLDNPTKKKLLQVVSNELKNRAADRIHSGKNFPMEIPKNSIEYCSKIGIDYENDKDATQKANIDISDRCRVLAYLYKKSQRQDRDSTEDSIYYFNNKLKTESTVVLTELIRKIMYPRKNIKMNSDVSKDFEKTGDFDKAHYYRYHTDSIDFEKPCNFDKVRNFCAKYTQSVRTWEHMFERRRNTNTRDTAPDFYGE